MLTTVPELRNREGVSAWIIAIVLFLSTVVNYLDRQTLSVLAPYIKVEYKWSNTDFAWLIIAFRAAYAIGQTLAGRFLDRVGVKLRGLVCGVSRARCKGTTRDKKVTASNGVGTGALPDQLEG